MGMDFDALTRENELGKKPKYPSKRFGQMLEDGIDIMELLEPMIGPSKNNWREGLVFRRGKKNGSVSKCHGFGYERVDIDTPKDRVDFVFYFKRYGLKKHYYEKQQFEFIPPIPELSHIFECGPFITPEKAGQGDSKRKPAKQDHRKSKSKTTRARLWRQLKKEWK